MTLLPFLDFRGCQVVDVKVGLQIKMEFATENAVASSKNNVGTSELVFGDEIL